jgi:hypothetical protein
VVTNNFFGPLRDLPMENAQPGSKGNSTKTSEINVSLGKVLTSEANLISLQRELKSIVTGEFFQNTETRMRNTTKSMVDYNAIQKFLTEKNLRIFTFYTKVINLLQPLSGICLANISAQDITVSLQEIDYNVISVKQTFVVPERGLHNATVASIVAISG